MIDYASPLFVDIVLYTIYTLVAVAVVLTVWSVVKGWKTERGERGEARRARRVALLTALLVVVTLVVTWLLGSAEPLTVNGEPYTNAFWLKTSDMLMATTVVLLVVLAIAGLVNKVRS